MYGAEALENKVGGFVLLVLAMTGYWNSSTNHLPELGLCKLRFLQSREGLLRIVR